MNSDKEKKIFLIDDKLLTRRREQLLLLLMFCLSASLYFFIAQDYRKLWGFTSHDNILFGLDQVDAVNGWVTKHKGIHPLMLLIVKPLCNTTALLTGSYATGLSLFCALVGGTTVCSFYLLCRLLSQIHSALVMTLFFSLSMNQIYFAALPDSYELCALSLMPSFALTILCIRHRQLYFCWWLVAGLFAFSVTITSSLQTAICFCAVHCFLKDKKLAWKTIVAFPIIMLILGVILSFVQRALYPGAQHFFSGGTYSHEMQYLYPQVLSRPGMVFDELMKNFFCYSFVGQGPRVQFINPEVKVRLVHYKDALDYGWIGLGACLLWLGLCIRAFYLNWKSGENRHLLWACLLSVGSNFLLFAFFNTDEVYLYVTHFSFITLLIIHSDKAMSGKKIFGCWYLLLLLVAVNNFTVQQNVVDKYSHHEGETLIAKNEVWRYFPGTQNPGAHWMQADFDDSKWKQGISGFGYGDGDDSTLLKDMRNNYSSVYTRKKFHINSLKNIEQILAKIHYDDGFVLYLNGKKVTSRNTPENPQYQSLATGDHGAKTPQTFTIPTSALNEGENTIAVMVLNRSLDSSDLSLIVELSIRKP